MEAHDAYSSKPRVHRDGFARSMPMSISERTGYEGRMVTRRPEKSYAPIHIVLDRQQTHIRQDRKAF